MLTRKPLNYNFVVIHSTNLSLNTYYGVNSIQNAAREGFLLIPPIAPTGIIRFRHLSVNSTRMHQLGLNIAINVGFISENDRFISGQVLQMLK